MHAAAYRAWISGRSRLETMSTLSNLPNAAPVTAVPSPTIELPLDEIARAVAQIRFGSVEIVIHDSRVVQIERREKLRFDKSSSGNGASSNGNGSNGNGSGPRTER